MEKDKRDLGDLRVYRRRRQGKYAQDSEEEQEPPMGVIQGTYRSVQKGKPEEPGKGKEGKGREEEGKSSNKGKKAKGKDKGKSKGKKGKSKDKGKKGKGKRKGDDEKKDKGKGKKRSAKEEEARRPIYLEVSDDEEWGPRWKPQRGRSKSPKSKAMPKRKSPARRPAEPAKPPAKKPAEPAKPPAKKPAEPAKSPAKASALDPEEAPECPHRQVWHQLRHLLLRRELQQPLLQRRLRHRGQGHHGGPSRKSTSSMSTRQPAARLRCLHRHGRSKLCGTFHPGGKGKEVYLSKELIKDKKNIDLYCQKRKVELCLKKSTRDKKNINLYYQKEKGNKEEEVSERKEGSGDEKEPRCKDKGKKEVKKEKRKATWTRTR